MPRFRQISELQKLMSNKKLIRNLGIIAHIDHGKTTLTDALLAGTGLLSPKMVGSARVLDYLKEEQRRGITMKAANISLHYQTAEQAFIINLVDTPGHVDFTGKVTRALRSIDGAIVVVDAVEEVMAQTEIVVQQALQERVHPVLFINKTDRLITEMKLNQTRIEEKLNRIIQNYSDLIEIHAELQFKKQWKANLKKDNVIFGSALHKWGFTLNTAKQKGIKFNDIINAYNQNEYEHLAKTAPLHKAILDVAVKILPNPLEAQKYRIEKIWKGNINSRIGQAMTDCDDNGPAVMCITNVQTDPEEGAIATGRLFSGKLKTGDDVFLVNAQAEGVVNQVSIYMGSLKESVDAIAAGNIAAVTGIEKAKPGETIVSSKHQEGMVPFERIKYVSEPVLTVAVEPKNPQDLPFLLEAMEKLATEDPNLTTIVNRETGEYLLSGMGELHLETATNHLKDLLENTRITTSQPRVVYKETITKKGTLATARSPNKQNRFTVQAHPTPEGLTESVNEEGADTKNVGETLAEDEDKNALMDSTGKTRQLRDVLDSIVSGFRFACQAGPLCGEPVRGVKINLTEAELSSNLEQRGQSEIARGIGKAIFGSFLTAKPRLLEPIYQTVISAPTELAGDCSRIISSRRGKVCGFEQKGTQAIINSQIPVAETFGLSQEMRSTTSGRAFWQSTLHHWEKLPEKLEAKIITETRKRKGLEPSVPKPEQFTEENT